MRVAKAASISRAALAFAKWIFQPESARGLFYLSRLVVSSGIGGIDQRTDHTRARGGLVQQLQSLSCEDGTTEPAGAGGVAAGAVETCGKTIPDRIGSNREHDRDCRSCGVGRECRLNSRCENHRCLAANQLGCKRRQLIVSAICPAKVDRDVLAFDVPDVLQSLAERGHTVRIVPRRPRVEKADHWQRRLLRARRERPRGRAGEQQEKVTALYGAHSRTELGCAPLHSITLSARRTSPAGISCPIALAVLRLMTSSNLVGCSMGRSTGLPPRKTLTTNRA